MAPTYDGQEMPTAKPACLCPIILALVEIHSLEHCCPSLIRVKYSHYVLAEASLFIWDNNQSLRTDCSQVAAAILGHSQGWNPVVNEQSRLQQLINSELDASEGSLTHPVTARAVQLDQALPKGAPPPPSMSTMAV